MRLCQLPDRQAEWLETIRNLSDESDDWLLKVVQNGFIHADITCSECGHQIAQGKAWHSGKIADNKCLRNLNSLSGPA